MSHRKPKTPEQMRAEYEEEKADRDALAAKDRERRMEERVSAFTAPRFRIPELPSRSARPSAASAASGRPRMQISKEEADRIRQRMANQKAQMQEIMEANADFRKVHNDPEQDLEGKSVIPYVIHGHGSEYEYKVKYKNGKKYTAYEAPTEEHSFILPSNCYVVSVTDPGKRINSQSDQYQKIYKNLCRMPYEVIKNPLKYHGEGIYDAFGPVTIYLPNKPCPNFGYELIPYHNPSDGFDMISFIEHGAGIIPIKILRTTFCKHKNLNFEGNTFENADTYVMNFFKDSINPTPQQVHESILSFKKDRLPAYMDDIMDVSKYTPREKVFAVRYLHAMFAYFNNTLRGIFNKTQKKICEEIALDPTKTYVFYNFVCRAVPESDRFFDTIDRTNVLRNNLSHNQLFATNAVYKKLIRGKISNAAMSRRHQIRRVTSLRHPSLKRSVKKSPTRSTSKSPRSKSPTSTSKSPRSKTVKSAANAPFPRSPKE
jgi:hypothetical protein